MPHPIKGKCELALGDTMTELTEFRTAKDQYFARDNDSPLLPEQRHHFHGLDYFPENASLRLALRIDEFSDSEKDVIEMMTSTGESRQQQRWGTFTFVVDGGQATLTVYRDLDGEEFFLPFADATSGRESYGAGRYLDLIPLENGQHLVDFNYAYNPYCAYNPLWSCPIPPAENRLQVPIHAGEKKFPEAPGSPESKEAHGAH